MIHVITIHHWTPTPLNKLMRNRWVAYKNKKRDREIIWGHCLEERIPAAKGKRKVEMLVMLKPKRGRRPDADNLLKTALDALVACRMLKDDNEQWCDWTKPVIETGTNQVWGTTFTLTDIE